MKLAAGILGLFLVSSLSWAGKWEPVPSEFQSYLQEKYHNLQYQPDEKFLRHFKYKTSPFPESPSYNISGKKIEFPKHASDEIKKCWNIFVSGGLCGRAIPAPTPQSFTASGELDLLSYVREVSRTNGLTVARDLLVQELRNKDSSKGEIRERILKTTADESFAFQDSIAKMPDEARKDIGVYMVLGFGGEKSPNAALINRAAQAIKSLGFDSEMLPVDANKGSEYNAALLNRFLQSRLPKKRTVLLVGASKGVADLITYFFKHGSALSEQERQKVKLFVSLSGVIRSSMVAKYLTQSKNLTAKAIRSLFHLKGEGDALDGMRSLARDPWENQDRAQIHRLFPAMKWLSFPAVPEGPEGLNHIALKEKMLAEPVYAWSQVASPMDGLVESAASILPPDTQIHEIIVPIFGPHAMAMGYYTPTLRVAPKTMNQIFDRVEPAAGEEILLAIFRALPASWLD